MEGRAAAEDVRDAEELICNQAEGGHTPMMLIFCTVNFVLVKAATSRASATTTNSSSHMVDVDIIFCSPIFFTTKRLTNTSLQGMLLL